MSSCFMINEEEEYEVQSVIKVYPDSYSALIYWSDNSMTFEPLEHLTHCDDCLLKRLNELYDRKNEKDEEEKALIIKLLYK